MSDVVCNPEFAKYLIGYNISLFLAFLKEFDIELRHHDEEKLEESPPSK